MKPIQMRHRLFRIIRTLINHICLPLRLKLLISSQPYLPDGAVFAKEVVEV